MIPCKSCGVSISSQATTCPHCGHPVPQDGGMALVGVIFAAVAVVMLMLCGGAGVQHDAGMRETPLTPYTQPTSQLAVLPKLATLRHDVTLAKLQILLSPACADRSEALELVDTILKEVNVLELRINNGIATAAEVAEFGEQMKQHVSQSEAIAARLRAASR